MTIKMLILLSQAIVNHSSMHLANILFSSDPDKTEIQVYFHMEPLVYPESVIVLCNTNTFELHMNEDPSFFNFVDLVQLLSFKKIFMLI